MNPIRNKKNNGYQRQYPLPWGDQKLTYYVKRSARRRTIGLRMTQGMLTVMAPPWVTLGNIEKTILDHKDWIEKHRQKHLDLPKPPQLDFSEGALLPWLGELRPISWVTQQLSLFPPPDNALFILKTEQLELIDIENHYKTQAYPYLLERVEHYAHQVNKPTPTLKLTNAKGRWGSCSHKGVIRLNWRLFKTSPREIDYIIAHEVAHLIHFNHSQAFWDLVATICPNFQECQSELRIRDNFYRQF
jgi:hypothetical protein